MNRTPLALAALAGASSLVAALPPLTASASSPPAPAAACTAVPDGATLVVGGPDGASIERAGGSEPLTLPVTSAIEKVVRGPDGTMWVQAFGERGVEVHRIGPDGAGGMLAIGPNLRLGTAGWHDERSAVTVLDPDFVIPNEVEMHGAVRVEYADGESRDIGPAGGPEYGVMSASIGAGHVVLGAWSDLTEAFVFYGADGTELENWVDPTDNAPYAEPPLFQFPAAALSGGGGAEELLWVEGPDNSGATNEVSGGWSLVMAMAVEGTELMRVDLGEQPGLLLDADWDGRFWVGTFAEPTDDSGETRPTAGRVIVVDTDAETPAPIDAACAPGVTATVDRSGSAQPAPGPPPTAVATTTVPSTVAPPPTTAPGQCADYTPADAAYPIQRCEWGGAVQGVQVMLIHRGFDIEADGYFGPATEAAVRQFQASAGLEVDGLVGPDTWGVLYDPNRLPGVEKNGNGMIDPWELIFDPGGGEESRTLTVEFSPTNPAPGGTVDVTGSGCDPGQEVTIWIQTDRAIGHSAVTADGSGSIATTITISDEVAPGTPFDVIMICGAWNDEFEHPSVTVNGTIGG